MITPLTYLKVGALAVALLYVAGLNVKIHNLRSHITREEQREAAATGRAIAAIRATETAHRAEVSAIDSTLTMERFNADQALKAALDGARHRAPGYVLREHFTCPALHGAGAAASAGASDAAAPRGLSAEDEDFLIRFAGEADALALDHQACQAVAVADRKP